MLRRISVTTLVGMIMFAWAYFASGQRSVPENSVPPLPDPEPSIFDDSSPLPAQPPLADDAFNISGGGFKPRSIFRSSVSRAGMRVRRRATVEMQDVYEPIPKDELERRKKWRTLQQQIRKTDDEEVRKKLGDDLRSVLEQIFDEDLNRRDADLEKLEARVKKLRDSIERRRTNRDRIINVQVDSVLLDAEGLTFPGGAEMQPQTTRPASADVAPSRSGLPKGPGLRAR